MTHATILMNDVGQIPQNLTRVASRSKVEGSTVRRKGRDIDNDASDDDTRTYDANGNLTDDGVPYKYEWDPFGRLRKVLNRSNDSLAAEYTYNGLNFRIGEHTDTDLDGDVDGDDDWFRFMYDEAWRIVATFREDDSDPREYFTYHAPGIGASGGSDRIILRDKDADTDWTAASDGTLEERIYYVQNWRGDVVNLLDDGGGQVESVRYSAYGVPFAMPAGDVDLDGAVDSADTTQIQAWIDAPSYDVLGDLDLDGDVDAADKSAASANTGVTLGRNSLSESALTGASSSATGNRFGYAAYVWDDAISHWHVRHRVYEPELGNWLSRDGIAYSDSNNLYRAVMSNPVGMSDPMGLESMPTGGEFRCQPKVPCRNCGEEAPRQSVGNPQNWLPMPVKDPYPNIEDPYPGDWWDDIEEVLPGDPIDDHDDFLIPDNERNWGPIYRKCKQDCWEQYPDERQRGERRACEYGCLVRYPSRYYDTPGSCYGHCSKYRQNERQWDACLYACGKSRGGGDIGACLNRWANCVSFCKQSYNCPKYVIGGTVIGGLVGVMVAGVGAMCVPHPAWLAVPVVGAGTGGAGGLWLCVSRRNTCFAYCRWAYKNCTMLDPIYVIPPRPSRGYPPFTEVPQSP